jgi:hypothetical protein
MHKRLVARGNLLATTRFASAITLVDIAWANKPDTVEISTFTSCLQYDWNSRFEIWHEHAHMLSNSSIS